jgi:hypothetical protein
MHSGPASSSQSWSFVTTGPAPRLETMSVSGDMAQGGPIRHCVPLHQRPH